MKYVATTNVPGYLPMSDDPPVFETVREAWSFLAQERTEAEDSAFESGHDFIPEGYSACKNVLDTLADSGAEADFANAGLDFDGTGSVHGPTPGYYGEHDLGLAYSVERAAQIVVMRDPNGTLVEWVHEEAEDVNERVGRFVVAMLDDDLEFTVELSAQEPTS